MKLRISEVKLTIGLVTSLLAAAIASPLAGQVAGRFYLNQDSFAVGEPLMFTLEIKNGSREVIYLFPRHQGQCSDPFSFSMQGTTQQSSGYVCGTTWDTQCKDDTIDVKPGESYTRNGRSIFGIASNTPEVTKLAFPARLGSPV